MHTLALSSFSLHSVLGPLRLERREEDGALSHFSFDFPKLLNLEQFVLEAREKLGVSAIELCQIQFETIAPERLRRLRDTLDAAGVRLLTVPIDVGDLAAADPAWRADDERRIAGWFEIAKRLGARFVRVNAGSVGSHHADRTRPGLIDALRRLGDRASVMGMRMLIENHGGTSSDPDFMLGLREDVGADRLGILLDLGNFDPLVGLSHARFADPDACDDKLDAEPVYDKIARLAPVADLVHAKSIDPQPDGRPLPDLDRAFAILKDAGYAGPISIEWEGRKGDPWERSAAIAAQIRAAFSDIR